MRIISGTARGTNLYTLEGMDTRPTLDWDFARGFMCDVFEKYGVPQEDARICADVLLESDRRGIESHGCNRFKPIYLDRIKAGILNPVTKSECLSSVRSEEWIGRPLRNAPLPFSA